MSAEVVSVDGIYPFARNSETGKTYYHGPPLANVAITANCGNRVR